MEKLKHIKECLTAAISAQLNNIDQVDAKELGEVVDMLKDVEQSMYYCAKTKEIEEKKEEREEMKEELEKLKKENPQQFHHYYTEKYLPYCPHEEFGYPYPYERDMDRQMGRMYYSEGQSRNAQGQFTDGRGRGRGGRRGFEEYPIPYEMMPYYPPIAYYGGSGSSGDNSGGRSGGNSGRSGGNSGGSRNFYEREVPFELRDEREGRSGMSRRNYMESKELHKDKEHKVKELEKYMQELSQDIVEMIEDASPEEKQMLEKKMTNLASKVAQLNRNA